MRYSLPWKVFSIDAPDTINGCAMNILIGITMMSAMMANCTISDSGCGARSVDGVGESVVVVDSVERSGSKVLIRRK